MKRCRVLLTWIGAQDPWRPIGGRRTGRLEPLPETKPDTYEDGPILTFLSNVEPFDIVYALCDPPLLTVGAATALRRGLTDRFPSVDLRLREIPIDDPRAYEPLYRQMRAVCEEATSQNANGEFHVLLSPGTPQMHAIWVLLTKTVFRAKQWQTSEHVDRSKADEVHIPFDIDVEIVEPARAEASDDRFPEVPGLVYRSEAMRRIVAKLIRTGRHEATILLLGETGVGKTRLAKLVHDSSRRAKGPFVVVDCTTLPRELAESELFGHEAGAYTGARKRRVGLFASASGGTVCLDEIGDLSPELQGKLLRVLENRVIRPVGSDEERSVDVRIVAATNRDLDDMVAEGRFRRDLLQRLKAVTITVPPLRERTDDIGVLVGAFLKRHNTQRAEAGDEPLRLSASATRYLRSLPWRGNVREIQQFIETLSLNVSPHTSLVDDLTIQSVVGDSMNETVGPSGSSNSIREATAKLEREMIRSAVAENPTQATAARALGLKSAQALQNRMRRLGLRYETAATRKTHQLRR